MTHTKIAMNIIKTSYLQSRIIEIPDNRGPDNRGSTVLKPCLTTTLAVLIKKYVLNNYYNIML